MPAQTYSVRELANLAGVSVRTLQYYDRIGLLEPKRHSNGYRSYTSEEANRLQLILLYRRMGMPLKRIGQCLDASDGTMTDLLRTQRCNLLRQRDEIERLIATVDATIDEREGGRIMEDAEKFEGLKLRMVEENEQRYGAEARDLYGDEAVDASNEKLKAMTVEQYRSTKDMGDAIASGLLEAMREGDPAGEKAQAVCDLHRRWLCRFWESDAYSPEAHRGMAEMYVADERFKAHYDAIAPGAAQFLHDALIIYCSS